MITRIFNGAILLLVVLVLAVGFYGNRWGVVDENYFQHYQEDSNSLVYGGLAHCRAVGLSRFGLWAASNSEAGFENPDWIAATQSAWSGQLEPKHWFAYKSQIGLQGTAYCILLKTRLIRGDQLVRLIRLVDVGLVTILVLLIVCWMWLLLDSSVSLLYLALLSLVFSPWSTQIYASVYWQAWTWYLPMAVAAYFCMKNGGDNLPRKNLLEAGCVFAAVLIKSLCGYEFISFVLVCMMVPFVVREIRTVGPVRGRLGRLAMLALSGLMGFGLAMIVHAAARAGINHISIGLSEIWSDVVRRTSSGMGDTSHLPTIVADSLRVPVAEVMRIYGDINVLILPFEISITAFQLFSVALLGLAVAIGECSWRNWKGIPLRREIVTMAAAVLLGFAAPVSWFALAKGHSFIHQTINPVLWIFPLVPFLLLFIGSLLGPYAAKLGAGALGPCLVAIVVLVMVSSVCNDIRLYTAGQKILATYGSRETGGSQGVVALSGRSLVFFVSDTAGFKWDSKFFVHVFPRDKSRLLLDRREVGFDNLDFEPMYQRINLPKWSLYSNALIFERQLPIYEIERVTIGQYSVKTGVEEWSTNISNLK